MRRDNRGEKPDRRVLEMIDNHSKSYLKIRGWIEPLIRGSTRMVPKAWYFRLTRFRSSKLIAPL